MLPGVESNSAEQAQARLFLSPVGWDLQPNLHKVTNFHPDEEGYELSHDYKGAWTLLIPS